MPLGLIPLIAVSIGVSIATHYINKLLAPKVRPPKPGELEVPVVEEGRPVPVIYGTVQLAPHIVGVWDRQARPSGNSFIYTAHMHGVLCHGPVDAVRDIQFDHISMKLLKPGAGDSIASGLGTIASPALPWLRPTIDPDEEKLRRVKGFLSALTAYSRSRAPNRDYSVYSGSGAEGGVAGPVDFYWGAFDDPTRTPDPVVNVTPPTLNTYLTPVAAPAYPGLCHVVFGLPGAVPNYPTYGQPQHFQWTKDTPYLKPVSFVLTRLPAHLELDCEGAFAPSDANPIQVVYEILTDRYYGLRLDPSLIDYASFAYAASIAEDEMLGVSFALTERTEAIGVIQDVLRHANATLYTDPTTGLLCVWMIREVASPEVLPLFDEGNVRQIEVARSSWRDTLNDVRVTFRQYVERAPTANEDGFIGFISAVVGSQNPAHALHVQETRSHTVDFSMFSRAVLAQRKADELVSELSAPRWSGSGAFDRTAFALFPGSAIRLSFPSYGISSLLARVTRVDYGDLEDGVIRIDWQEDATADVASFSGLPVDPLGGDSEPPPPPPPPPPGEPPEPGDPADPGADPTQPLSPLVGPLSVVWPAPTFLRHRFADGEGVDWDGQPTSLLYRPDTDDAHNRFIAHVQQRHSGQTAFRAIHHFPAPAADITRLGGEPFSEHPLGILAHDYDFTTEGVDATGFTVIPISGLAGFVEDTSASDDDRDRGGTLGNSTGDPGNPTAMRFANRVALLGGFVHNPTGVDPAAGNFQYQAEYTSALLRHAELVAFKALVDNLDGTFQVTGVVRAVLNTVPPPGGGIGVSTGFSPVNPTTWPPVSRWKAGTLVRLPGPWGFLPVRRPATRDGEFPLATFARVSWKDLAAAGATTNPGLMATDPYGPALHLAPYPPARLRINGLGLAAWPATVAGDVVLTWARRHRTDQGLDYLVRQEDGDQGSALEGSYMIEVLIIGSLNGDNDADAAPPGLGNTFRFSARTVLSTTSQTFTYTYAQRLADEPDLSLPTVIRITPRRGDLPVLANYSPVGARKQSVYGSPSAWPLVEPLRGEPFVTPPIYHVP